MKLKKESPFRKYPVGLDVKVPLPEGRLVNYINFDNAATTPPLFSVMQALIDFAPWYSSIHRGKGYKSQLSSQIYEESRSIIASFVGANLKEQTVIFVKNATEGINKLAYRLNNNDNSYIIISSEMEHHSNDLPWRNKSHVDYISIDGSGQLSLEDLETKLIKYRGKVKLVAISGASNVTGFINPIYQIAGLAHRYGAQILVDGAQLVPHMPVQMSQPDNEHLDYLVFSAHKMYAPFGTGVLIGPRQAFENGEPEYSGGGTVQVVTHKFVSWAGAPQQEEAGTPNLMGVVALTEAIKILSKLGMEKIAQYEKGLTDYTIEEIKKIPEIITYDDKKADIQRVGIIPFNIKGLSHELTATILAEEAGIAVRNGCFCAQPYIQKLLNIPPAAVQRHIKYPELIHPGLVRISFGMYNNYSEVDCLLKKLSQITKNIKIYKNR